ncbi:RNA polymerase, sigma-24 subunit, ECF subfamily [Clostridium aceticum]|uniref:RNA polymerase, sigma-24 subunit, ECF subfamily n=1 Tax=Clostridium aceticum TaxID=84022 RepID=A0A0D8IEF4_9CLOT|nr:RNA polymerase sigma factor [Clostridium aceticum]AKL96833.1 RNA polymerase, sigma-24 subunit, ECF subfamily [Clostridium aceticum]KJF27581.1 RNA polymerase subunit sigma-24 [Clostridium aceticum]
MDRDFTLLYEKYKQPIFSYIYYLSQNTTEAEEVCQDVFLKVYLNIDKFEGRSSLRTWIYRIAKNTFLEYKRKTKKEVLMEEITLLNDPLLDEASSPEDCLLNNEAHIRIKETLMKISEKHRTFIILRDIQNLSYQEISEITDLKLNTVKVNIYRARSEFEKIYKRLEGQ